MNYLKIKNTSINIEDGDRGKNYPSPSELKSFGYCLFLNNKNIINHKLDLNETYYITKEKCESLGKGLIDFNNIIMTTRGSIGNLLLVNQKFILPARINSGMIIFKNFTEYIPKFLYFYFQSNHFQLLLKKNSSGSAQPQIPIKDLENLPVPLLDLNTQQHIVDTIHSALIFQ